jgi:signal transduction histidine kinase/CheY-like chemotaxis protein
VQLEQEADVVLARQRARQLAAHLGFSVLDQTQIATAVSEIARNAHEYAGGGRIEFSLSGNKAPQVLEIVVSDSGPGITNIDDVLAGAHLSQTGMGLGICGARRLMDSFTIETKPNKGTRVELRKILPAKSESLKSSRLAKIAGALAEDRPKDNASELRQQNRELMLSLETTRRQREELAAVNQELQDTNRGVVALYAELDERAEHLRRADELKTRFLSNMSHEFRTPLNSILALSRFLLDGTDGTLSDEQIKQVGFIRKSAENLSELVNDLLDLAKVEAGKTVINSTVFLVDDLFGALRGMLRPLLVGDLVSLAFDDVEALPPLQTDEGKVSQILRNFISNALKFTERGSVSVGASISADKLSITFTVRDTGIGIDPEHHELIFQEFAQIENPLQYKARGTGLGLPLSKRLAELLGGSVAVKSEPGIGSLFSLTIPCVYQPAMAPDYTLEAEQIEAGRLPVILLEDNLADLAAIQTMLRGTSYQILPARSLVDARRLLQQWQPKAVILDAMIGEDFSWQLLADLKASDVTANIPVVVVSTADDRGKALSLGAAEFLLKPVGRDDLLDLLARVIEGASQQRILVIDDDDIFRYVVRQELANKNVRVLEAATGLAGLERASKEAFDVVLLDLDLPDITGFEVLKQLKHGEQDPPIVIVSGMRLTPSERVRLGRAHSIIPKSELIAGQLKTIMQSVLRKPGAAN